MYRPMILVMFIFRGLGQPHLFTHQFGQCGETRILELDFIVWVRGTLCSWTHTLTGNLLEFGRELRVYKVLL